MTNAWVRLLLACVIAFADAGAAAEIAQQDRRSGFEGMSADLQAMQRDDLANPGMLFVADGEAAWSAPAGTPGRSCAGCHGGIESMRGVAARYPAFDQASGRPIALAGKIDQCRADRQGAKPAPTEAAERLALLAAVAKQSRGMAIAPSADPRLTPFREEGRRLFETRFGQLDLSCAECHDANWGRRLAGNLIPQGHPTGYPIYRLEWQSLGSLERRLRNCMTGVRAEPFPPGAPEAVALELYLMQRASGLPVETPAIRP